MSTALIYIPLWLSGGNVIIDYCELAVYRRASFNFSYLYTLKYEPLGSGWIRRSDITAQLSRYSFFYTREPLVLCLTARDTAVWPCLPTPHIYIPRTMCGCNGWNVSYQLYRSLQSTYFALLLLRAEQSGYAAPFSLRAKQLRRLISTLPACFIVLRWPTYLELWPICFLIYIGLTTQRVSQSGLYLSPLPISEA